MTRRDDYVKPATMDLCVTCGVFLFDWMCRPLPPTDYFISHVRKTYLKKAIPELLAEMHRLLSKVNYLMKYMIDTKIQSILQERKKSWYRSATLDQELLELEWTTTVQLFREYVSFEDIEVLLVLIDEKYILDTTITSELWLGMMLRTLMKELPQIHAYNSHPITSGLICPKEHMIACEIFDSVEDDIYA
jgi:hypothetical protein